MSSRITQWTTDCSMEYIWCLSTWRIAQFIAKNEKTDKFWGGAYFFKRNPYVLTSKSFLGYVQLLGIVRMLNYTQ